MSELECIKMQAGGRTIRVTAFTWKTDRHKRVRFNIYEVHEGAEAGESTLCLNADDTDVLGFLAKEIVSALGNIVPA
jgi:hypothetical protein